MTCCRNFYSNLSSWTQSGRKVKDFSHCININCSNYNHSERYFGLCSRKKDSHNCLMKQRQENVYKASDLDNLQLPPCLNQRRCPRHVTYKQVFAVLRRRYEFLGCNISRRIVVIPLTPKEFSCFRESIKSVTSLIISTIFEIFRENHPFKWCVFKPMLANCVRVFTDVHSRF